MSAIGAVATSSPSSASVRMSGSSAKSADTRSMVNLTMKTTKGRSGVSKAATKMRARRDSRRAAFDALRKEDMRGRKRPGSLKKKSKGAAWNKRTK